MNMESEKDRTWISYENKVNEIKQKYRINSWIFKMDELETKKEKN